jgi:hypothetical protein
VKPGACAASANVTRLKQAGSGTRLVVSAFFA